MDKTFDLTFDSVATKELPKNYASDFTCPLSMKLLKRDLKVAIVKRSYPKDVVFKKVEDIVTVHDNESKKRVESYTKTIKIYLPHLDTLQQTLKHMSVNFEDLLTVTRHEALYRLKLTSDK